jgi:hypothetical protein
MAAGLRMCRRALVTIVRVTRNMYGLLDEVSSCESTASACVESGTARSSPFFVWRKIAVRRRKSTSFFSQSKDLSFDGPPCRSRIAPPGGSTSSGTLRAPVRSAWPYPRSDDGHDPSRASVCRGGQWGSQGTACPQVEPRGFEQVTDGREINEWCSPLVPPPPPVCGTRRNALA